MRRVNNVLWRNTSSLLKCCGQDVSIVTTAAATAAERGMVLPLPPPPLTRPPLLPRRQQQLSSCFPSSMARLRWLVDADPCQRCQHIGPFFVGDDAGVSNNIMFVRPRRRSLFNNSSSVVLSANHHYCGSSSSFSTSAAATAAIETDNDDDDDVDDETSKKTKPMLRRRRAGVRNIAVIAHVDHGKTTLVDQLLKAASSQNTTGSSSSGSNSNAATTEERLLDCGDLEKERGITITSKVTRIDNYVYGNGDDNNNKMMTINVVDTPGHADFCGEVDRILSLVDGVCLVVDASEGPMAQTKYVLSRALSLQLKPMVILNKVDRPEGWNQIENGETESSLLDLFDSLGATDDQMDYVTLYASARDGWVTEDVDVAQQIVERGIEACRVDVAAASSGGHDNDKKDAPLLDMTTLLDRMIQVIPEPSVHVYNGAETDDDQKKETKEEVSMTGESIAGDRFSLAAVTVGYDPYLGRTCTGRIYSGSVSINDDVSVLRREDDTSSSSGEKGSSSGGAESATIPTTTLNGIFVNKGISRVPLENKTAYAGDIVTLSGVPDSIRVGDTLTGSSEETRIVTPIETPPLAPPTLSMEFGANDGPLKGTEGTEVTPSKLRARLVGEVDNNVTLSLGEATSEETTEVFARGELQLGILVETLRREGFEMVISPPKIVIKDVDGTTVEPYEECTVDVDSEYAGYIVSSLTGDRKGALLEMNESADGKTRLKFEIPSRGLLGFAGEAASATRGSAVVNHVYLEDRAYAGLLGDGLEKGKLISSDSGKATQYALSSLASRGVLFVAPGDVVYPGQIIGENAKQGDMEVNPVRAKAATNMRTQAKDEKVYLAPPKRMTVEELIGYMADDECLEVTPSSLRLRKATLDPVERRKASRVKKQQQTALKDKKK